jgi:hypothetical protein
MACAGSDLTLPGDGSPSALRAISGDGQEGTVGTELPKPLVARLVDGAGHPLPEVSLEFRFRDDVPAARIEPSEIVATNDSGFASVRVRLGSRAGSQTVEASLAEATSDLSTSFDLTALEKEPDDEDGDDRSGRGRGRGHDREDDDEDDDD